MRSAGPRHPIAPGRGCTGRDGGVVSPGPHPNPPPLRRGGNGSSPCEAGGGWEGGQ
ncbi:hypothetical protein [Azospirillum argentinense]